MSEGLMQIVDGIAASPGVAVGEAFVLDNEGFRISRRLIPAQSVESELLKLRSAVDSVSGELDRHRTEVTEELGEQYGAIFSAQSQMLRDPKLQQEVEDLILRRHFSPEYAVSRTLHRFAKVFQNLENRFMAERAHDILDIEKRLLRNLLGLRREALAQLNSPVVVMAHDLTPSETAKLDRRHVLGFVSEVGGAGGHSAIVAKALEIPAVVGTGPVLAEVSSGDQVIIDGDQGRVIIRPDEATIRRYRQTVEQHRSQVRVRARYVDLPAETRDGCRIRVYANIEFPHEVEACLKRGGDGVGLYRTEFLYLSAGHAPSEEQQYAAYVEVVQRISGRPVVIRTLDLGADKVLPQDEEFAERNPFLGLRSIRLSLRHQELFHTQLRAIARASVHGDVRIMFPLVSTLQELRHAKHILADIYEDLEEEQIPFNPDMKVGMMVEVPATVLMLDRFIREVDFISIGTNDLVQYTLAVDRSNREVAGLYNACDPSVLRQIARCCEVAQDAETPVTLCGDMSSNSVHTMLLLGLGLRDLSVPPGAIPELKQIIRAVTIAECREAAQRAMQMENPREIMDYLTQRMQRVLADAPSDIVSAIEGGVPQ